MHHLHTTRRNPKNFTKSYGMNTPTIKIFQHGTKRFRTLRNLTKLVRVTLLRSSRAKRISFTQIPMNRLKVGKSSVE